MFLRTLLQWEYSTLGVHGDTHGLRADVIFLTSGCAQWVSVFASPGQAPRSEALTILGSLVCFPNIYQEIPLLRPVAEAGEVIAGTADVKVTSRPTRKPFTGLMCSPCSIAPCLLMVVLRPPRLHTLHCTHSISIAVFNGYPNIDKAELLQLHLIFKESELVPIKCDVCQADAAGQFVK